MALCSQNKRGRDGSSCWGFSSVDSIPSEEGNIYNAARVSSAADDNTQDHHVNGIDGQLGTDLVMFMSLTPIHDIRYRLPVRRFEVVSEEQIDSTMWPSHALSRSYPSSTAPSWRRTETTLSVRSLSRIDEFHRPRRRKSKSASLNDVDSCWRELLFPESFPSPVGPVLPKYPPPMRSTTPPGLPSFGSREALCYSAQVLVRPSPLNGRGQQHVQVSSNAQCQGQVSNQHTSYRQLLRRFLGLSSSTPTPSSDGVVRGIGRAEDGTVVQGRFPYRQSGHGVNIARRLEDHPFHRLNLPIAECGGCDANANVTIQRGRPNRPPNETKGGISAHGNSGRLSRPRTLHSSRVVAPSPGPAATFYPWGQASAATVRPMPQDIPHQDCRAQPHYRSIVSADRDGFSPPSPGANSGVCGGWHPSVRQPSLNVAMQPTNPAPEQASNAQERTNIWTSSLRIAHSYFSCCSDEEADGDTTVIELSSSRDTYATARSWNESNNNPRANCPGGPE